MMSHSLKLLIDADMFAYKACTSVTKEIDWGNNLYTFHADIEEAKAYFEDAIDYALESALQKHKFSGDYEPIFCFTDDNGRNFRKKLLPTYKANRGKKPLAYGALKTYIKNSYESCQIDSLEADDCMGILSTLPNNKDNCILISGDKDINTLAGYHYDFIHDEYYYVTQEEADFFFLQQVLTGDTTDGYSGCPSIGKVTAVKLLTESPTWETVIKAYKRKGLTEQEALVQARVARILRAGEYDFKLGRVILWKPKEEC